MIKNSKLGVICGIYAQGDCDIGRMGVFVREKDDSLSTVYAGFGIARVGCAKVCVGGTGIEKVYPFGVSQGSPQVVSVPAVLYGVMPRPVRFGIAACEVSVGIVSGAVVALDGAEAIWLVFRGSAVPSACAPAEQVYPSIVGA